MIGSKPLPLLLSLWLIFAILTGCSSARIPTPKVEKGLINLAGYDFTHGAPVNLDGEWEVLPQNEKGPSGLKIYSLTVTLDNSPLTFGLYIPGSIDVKQVWINDIPVNAFPGTGVLDFLENRGGKIEIKLGTKNLSPEQILFGSKEQILKIGFNQFGLDIFFIVVILFAGLYQFMIFCLRKKEKAYLFSAVFCITAALYTASIPPEPVLLFFFPGMGYYTYYSISLLSSITSNMFFVFYVNAIYPGRISSAVLKFVKAMAPVFAAVIILMNLFDYWQPLYPFYYCNLALYVFLSLYMFVILIRIQKENKDALIILSGFVILSITSALYLIYNNLVATGLQINKLGWAAFVLIQAFILSRRSARAFTGVEELTDRLIRVNRLKDDFLITTAHELKTPLHGIIGMGESLLEHRGDPDSLPLIVSSARRLTELVNNILTFSRMKNQDVTLQMKPLSVWQVADVVFAVMRPMAREKHITLKNEIDEGIPSVHADENSLFRIIYNLVGNALKFTESGEIRVTAVRAQDMLSVSVCDTGIGIAPDKLKKLFLPFEDTGTYENTSENGTGLGLAITKRLVEMQGGGISVQSRPDMGSTFTFTLPLSDRKAQNTESRAMPYENKDIRHTETISKDIPGYKTKKKPYTILIADDEPVNLRVFTDMLRNEDYDLVTAAGTTEVFRLLEEQKKPDLVILDVMMPKMSGYEVCRRLREKYSLYELPILLVTIKNQPADILAGFEAGANDYLTKPFHERELKARIKNQLDIKTALNKGIRAEMNFLQAQIKPHFLYNTLNTIISLIRTQPDKASELMVALSNYLREIFGFDGTETMVPLKRELDTVRAYLDIITARFPDRISVMYDIEPVEGVTVPHLILQPVAENAVKHGILPKNAPGSISIKVADQGGHVVITIEDDGMGMDKEKIGLLLDQKLKNAGIGVTNVNKRMSAIYGHGLEIESELGKGTCVTFRIPGQGGTLNEDYSAG